jgi:5-methylcytosine-specific restriction endonuclease McrA
MPSYGDALRGYAHFILKRDGFKCRYCGLDGTQWPNWLYLSWDHLLPKGHPERDNTDFIVAACRFCNEVHNRTDFPVEGKTPEELVEQKKRLILEKRAEYKQFFDKEVKSNR